jgi:hypothetical protein
MNDKLKQNTFKYLEMYSAQNKGKDIPVTGHEGP